MGKRIALATYGSLGDLHPYLAVALELKRRGHHPIMATSECYRSHVAALDLDFHLVRPDMADFGDPTLWMHKAMDLKKGPRYVLQDLMLPHLRHSYDDLRPLIPTLDGLVSHPIAFAAPLLAEEFGLPWLGSVLQPICFGSAYDLCIYPNLVEMCELLRRMGPVPSGWLGALARLGTRSWMAPVDDLRREIGLPPSSLNPLFEGQFSPWGNLALFSSVLAHRAVDWPVNTEPTGFTFYDGPPVEGRWRNELSTFLAAGPPPIVFTLGSSAVQFAGNFYEVAAQAAQALGYRAILLIGREGRNQPKTPLSDTILALDYAPYGEVFPHAAAIVHQGGVGTTAQALRSGKPTIIVPFSHDQPDNASRIQRMGVGLALPRKRLNLKTLTAALDEILHSPNYRAQGEIIATQLQKENGPAAACDAIERLLGF
jgi:rhamnosyltransferase subunit B